MKRWCNSIPLLVALFCASVAPAVAQETANKPTLKQIMDASEKDAEMAKSVAVMTRDPLGRDTPLSTFHAFSKALSERNFTLVLEYMDMRNLPASLRGKGPEIAREIKIIGDRNIWVNPDTVSNKAEGHLNDGQPPYRDLLTRINTPEGNVDILLQRVPDGKGNLIWKLSGKTIAEVPKLYRHYGYGKLGDTLSRWFPEVDFAGLLLWQWLMLLAISVTAFLLAWLMTTLISLVLRNNLILTYPRLSKLIRGPIRFLLMVILFHSNISLISPGIEARAVISSNTLIILALSWISMGVVEIVLGRLGDRMRKNGNLQAATILKPVINLCKVIIFFIAALMWLDNLGFKVSTLLAGLGVGGIAVGLAAQKSIENFIGAITIYAAQPMKVGDFCRIGSTLGIVEEIGLRATSLRTLERTIVTIPNSTLNHIDIENLSQRDMILYRHTLQLAMDTTPDQIRTILADVKSLLLSRNDLDPDPARIRFKEYGEYSLNFEVYVYVKTNSFDEYLAISEELNLSILDIITRAGTHLAVPARAVSVSPVQIEQNG